MSNTAKDQLISNFFQRKEIGLMQSISPRHRINSKVLFKRLEAFAQQENLLK